MAFIPTDRVIQKLDEMLRKNDYVSAKKHLLYWLEEAKTNADDKASLLITNELMGLTRKLGEGDEAVGFAESALGLVERMGIQTNLGAATTYLNSATVYKAFSRAEESIPLFKRAQEIYEGNLSKDDARLGGLYNNMGLSLVDLNRFDEANHFYKKAIGVMARIPSKEPEQAITYLNIATAAEMQFGLEDGEKIIAENIEKAIELLDVGKDRLDGDYAFVCEKCATVFEYYGYFFYKNKLVERYRRIYERA